MRFKIAFLCLFAGCASEAEPTTTAEDQPLYVASGKLWPQSTIPACWENPTDSDATERGWVQDAVASSWSRMANIDFTGWARCPPYLNNSYSYYGIRIRVSDEGPHTNGIGTTLRSLLGGVVLNFTFQNWSQSCQSDREFCIRAIAVHEFGHALGFAHEQNRSDTPSTCTEPAQGEDGDVVFGAWDLRSVMNYCNPSWNGDGKLSLTDILGVQHYYQPRSGLEAQAFDPTFYLQYADLTTTFGAYGHMDAASHWLESGMSEGRAGTPGFSARFYLDRYSDLQATYGQAGYPAAATHWANTGVDEARMSSPAFDVAFYLRAYGDLRSAVGATGYRAALDHWNQTGINEGRFASFAFDPKYYLGRYADLRATFGATNYAAALRHFEPQGLSEGRAGSPVFDPGYYLATNPDLRAAFGPTGYHQALIHWLVTGIGEGRRASAEFDPKFYLASNPDVTTVYGSYAGAIEHYLLFGRFEGRRGAAPDFAWWASFAGVRAVAGDFDGDGRADVALVGGGGWTTIPVALSHGDGTFTTTNHEVGEFASWAASTGAQALVGDFNGDGRADIALTGVTGWTTIPIALSNGDGTFTVTNRSVASFPSWAAAPGAKAVVGDFNGDGRADLALTGVTGWTTVPIALSSGDGTFTVTNPSAPTFAQWAAAGATPLAGDFDHDGRADIALTGVPGWTTIPIAFTTGNGTFTIANHAVASFPAWAAAPGAKAVVGDFNHDGYADIALTGVSGWTTLPVAFSLGNASFSVTNVNVPNFPAWAATGSKLVVGDFNGDHLADLALTGVFGWTTLPVAFSTQGGAFTVTNQSL